MSPAATAATRAMEKDNLLSWKLSYRLDEATAATGIGRTTLYRRAKEGKLLMRRDGGNTIILRTDLLSFLEALPAAVIRGKI